MKSSEKESKPTCPNCGEVLGGTSHIGGSGMSEYWMCKKRIGSH